MIMHKTIVSGLIALTLLASTGTALATTYSEEDFLTVMLNYKYSEDYKVSNKSFKCGDTDNTLSTSNWYLDVDNLNINGKTNETYLYFGGQTYLLTGTFKHKGNKGIYKINLDGDYATEQASGTADVTVTGSLDDNDPYVIKKLKIKVIQHRTADFTVRKCTQKATVKSMDAYTFLMN